GGGCRLSSGSTALRGLSADVLGCYRLSRGCHFGLDQRATEIGKDLHQRGGSILAHIDCWIVDGRGCRDPGLGEVILKGAEVFTASEIHPEACLIGFCPGDLEFVNGEIAGINIAAYAFAASLVQPVVST